MIYKKIRMDFRDCKERFYRVLLVREDVNLVELGCIMCTAVKAQFEHLFLFHKKKTDYVPEAFLDDWQLDEWLPMNRYKLADLGDTFVFEYDTGDGWEFNCKVYKKAVEKPGKQYAYLLDGKGQGIWEDNIYSLWKYLDGEVDPDSGEENEEEGIYLPWNFENEKYSDFDNFDLEEEQELFESGVPIDMEMYINNAHEYGYEMNIKTLDTDDYFEDIYEEETEEYNPHLNQAIMEAVDNQIKTVDYIADAYKRLKKKYSDEEARRQLAVVLTEEIYECMKNNKESDQEAYRKKIENLK